MSHAECHVTASNAQQNDDRRFFRPTAAPPQLTSEKGLSSSPSVPWNWRMCRSSARCTAEQRVGTYVYQANEHWSNDRTRSWPHTPPKSTTWKLHLEIWRWRLCRQSLARRSAQTGIRSAFPFYEKNTWRMPFTTLASSRST